MKGTNGIKLMETDFRETDCASLAKSIRWTCGGCGNLCWRTLGDCSGIRSTGVCRVLGTHVGLGCKNCNHEEERKVATSFGLVLNEVLR